jgi:hypothetical protein
VELNNHKSNQRKISIDGNFRPPYPINIYKTGTFLNNKESIVFESREGLVVVLLNQRCK